MRISITIVPHRFTTMLRCAALAAMLCTGFAEPATAQAPPTPPAPPPFTDVPGLPADEPQSARIAALLEAVNSGERDSVLAFIKENFTPRFREQIPEEHHAHVLLGIGRNSGGYELHGLRTYDPPKPPTNRTVIVRNRLFETWEAFVIDFEPAPPHRIDNLSLSMARPPVGVGAQAAAPLTLEQAAGQLNAFLERLAKAELFSGSALLAKDGKIIFTFVSGEASKAFNAPNTLDTKFNLGSMNKMFTAIAIAQLVEAGRLSFDDPIGKYLGPDWLASEARNRITIAQLLSHTSGLGSHFTDEFWKSSRDLYRNLDDFKPLIVDQEPTFEPGTQWQYSNSGFLLLGAVIEKVTGGTYDDYLAAHILKPAGMTDTGCYEMDIDTPNLAIGYSREPNPDGNSRWVNNLFKHVIKGGSAGGGFSTAPDLLRFDQALRGREGGKLVANEMLNTLWSPKPASPNYGFGFQLDSAPNGGRIVGHGGGFPGISSVLDMHLDTGVTFIAMCNYDEAAVLANRKCRELLARVR